MAVRRVSVLHAWGAGSGPDRLHVELRDETLIAQIGVIEDDVEFSDVTSLAELQARAQTEFDKRKNVFTTAVVRAPLSVLPDDLTVGDTVTLIDPASGTVVAMDVREISIEEDAGGSEIVRLGLGTEIRDIIDEVLAGRAKPSGVRAIVPPTSPAPQSLANVTVTFSPDELYADAQGNWWVRATLNLAGVPRDTRREYILMRYRRVGDQLYLAGPAIYAKGPTGAASVAGLVPNVVYEFRIVPVGIGGVEGVGVAVTHTTAKDPQAPAAPIANAGSIIRGISVTTNQPTETDWERDEVHISTTPGYAPVLVADDWKTAYNSTVTPKWEISRADTYDGFQSQRMRITSSTGFGGAIVFQIKTAAAGQLWTNKVRVKGSRTGTGVIFVRLWFMDSDGTSLQENVLEFVPDSTWTERSVTATAPVGTAIVQCDFGVRAKAAGDTVDAYFDTAWVSNGSTNLYSNAGFEVYTGKSSPTLAAQGRQTHFEITQGMVAGTTYYASVVRFDTSGNVSAPSAEVSVVAGVASASDMDEALFFVVATDCAGYLSPGVWKISLTGGAYQLAQTEDTYVYAPQGGSASIRSYLGCSINTRPSFELKFRSRLSGVGWECGLRGVEGATYAVRSPFALVQPGTNAGTIKFITGSATSLLDAVTDNIGVDPTQWHTYVIRVDNLGNKLFVDGVLVAWHSGQTTHAGQIVFALAPASGSASLTLDYVVMKYTS